uniref:isoleucine--tRNA ligase n=1 Tax=Tetraselmis sp. GSL018 TaxID=582737 RepID=A0A061R806_9CHLO
MEAVLEGKDYSFPDEELQVLRLWEELDAFHEQNRRLEGKPEYIFYDGPPFATGLPHYGHILAGTIKDVVTRFAASNGYHVTRRFGWDCHGLPVEYEIDKSLGIKSREDVLNYGIANYNEQCRSIVMRYSSEWRETITRLGRWIDFENDYKTMQPSFMESVWWVFKSLWEKGLVYKGYKVMPYSTACTTPLSNFEAGQNYREVSDPAIMVTFPLEGDPESAHLVAWTTTPWTLPSNLALCVNADFDYVRVRDPKTGAVYIVAESRLPHLPGAVPKKPKKAKANPEQEKGFEVLSKFKGSELKGRSYTPLFPYFQHLKETGAFRICCDGYVTDDSGTGVVHQAPAFGEDDYRVCIENGIVALEELPCPLDAGAVFVDPVKDFCGMYVKDADKHIIAHIKAAGRLFDSAALVHSYPFCWRSDTPLIYRAVPSWFVKVTTIKERLLENNTQTYWVPSYVKEKRFHNWLENAHDWNISRSRFWGTPLPIWASADGEELVVVGSVAELEELSGRKVTDLHRHFIDDIVIPSKQGRGDLRRVDDVFDCWFESGSMPYGQLHYPFENKELFEANFPANFIAEGLDQTRGWFYTLMVLSTALFDKPAFQNLVCNGLVLAADGKKMSKRLKNYPDPKEVVSKYGADALRLYLVNSPVVRAEPLRFREEGVFDNIKSLFLPWYNAYRFLVQNVRRMEMDEGVKFEPNKVDVSAASNVLDRWINSASRSLVRYVKQEMEAYRLYTVAPFLVKFIENLTNIYVRFNRKRLKGAKGQEDTLMALTSLYGVLLTVCRVMGPLTPFFTESMYQNLRRVQPELPRSLHWLPFPEVEPVSAADEALNASVERMMLCCQLGHTVRIRNKVNLKTPLKSLTVVHGDTEFLGTLRGELKEYIMEELNMQNLETCSDPLKFSSIRAEPEWGVLGKRLGKAMGAVAAAIKKMGTEEVLRYEAEGKATVNGVELVAGDIRVARDFKMPEGAKPGEVDAEGDGEVLVVLDMAVDESMLRAGVAREVVNRFQKLRKKAGLEPTDPVELFYRDASGKLGEIVAEHGAMMAETLGSLPLPDSARPGHAVVYARETQSVGSDGLESSFEAVLAVPSVTFGDALAKTCGGAEAAEKAKVWLASRDPARLRAESASGPVEATIDGEKVFLTAGRDFFLSAQAAAAAATCNGLQ